MKNYVLIVLAENTKRVFTTVFTCNSEYEAQRDFKACYRHGEYTILSVTEIPDGYDTMSVRD